MDTVHWGWAGAAALLGFWTLGAYNRLMALRNGIGTAFAQVDEALRQRTTALGLLASDLPERHDDVPGLDGLLQAQSQVQAAADALRAHPARADRASRLAAAEAALDAEMVLLDAWLSRAAQDDTALALHAAALHDARQRLSFARQYFNDAVRGHNEATQQFPTRLIAGLFGFAAAGSL